MVVSALCRLSDSDEGFALAGAFVTSSRGGLVKTSSRLASFAGADWTDIAWMEVGIYLPDDCGDPDSGLRLRARAAGPDRRDSPYSRRSRFPNRRACCCSAQGCSRSSDAIDAAREGLGTCRRRREAAPACLSAQRGSRVHLGRCCFNRQSRSIPTVPWRSSQPCPRPERRTMRRHGRYTRPRCDF